MRLKPAGKIIVFALVAASALAAWSVYAGKSPVDLLFPAAPIKKSVWPGHLVLPSDNPHQPPTMSSPVPTPASHRRGAKQAS